jgi:hypothetical protein
MMIDSELHEGYAMELEILRFCLVRPYTPLSIQLYVAGQKELWNVGSISHYC